MFPLLPSWSSWRSCRATSWTNQATSRPCQPLLLRRLPLHLGSSLRHSSNRVDPIPLPLLHDLLHSVYCDFPIHLGRDLVLSLPSNFPKSTSPHFQLSSLSGEHIPRYRLYLDTPGPALCDLIMHYTVVLQICSMYYIPYHHLDDR